MMRIESAKPALATAKQKVVNPRHGLRLVAFLLLAVVGLLCLVVLDYALNTGLWGEFVFALVVTWAAIAIAGHVISDARWKGWGIAPPTTLHAPFWAAFVLVAVPLAIVSRWSGVVVLVCVGLGVYFLLPWMLERLKAPKWTEPSVRLSVFATVITMLSFVQLWTAHAARERVPAAATRRALVPGSDQLASRYRPVLFFDREERFLPLNIGQAIAADQVAICRKTVRGESCDRVTSETAIDQNADYLSFSSEPLGPRDSMGGAKSAYYYHLVDERPPRLYIDYWWFFAENPEPVASAILCRAGLRAPEVSCFQHQGDWEGITVVLAPCDLQPEAKTECVSFGNRRLHLVQVNYAQHNGVKKRPWLELERTWSEHGLQTYGEHPLVYVALNSHASYTRPCSRRCGRETSYNGRLPWGNNGPSCETDENRCLQPLSLDEDGRPALWNAFPGPWGAQHCILAGAYCDGGPAPKAPSFHRRYDRPDDPN